MPVTGPQTENRTWANRIEPLWTSKDPHSASRCAEKSTPGKGGIAATPKHAAKTNVHKYEVSYKDTNTDFSCTYVSDRMLECMETT